MSSQNTTVDTNTTIAESFVRANIVPNKSLVASIKDASRRHDWAGRVIANVDITRNPIRAIIADKADFDSFRSFTVKQIVDKIGKGFFVTVSKQEVEEKTKVKYFLKVRVAKMERQEPKPPKSEAPTPTTTTVPETEEFKVVRERVKPVEEIRPRALLNNKNAFALLGGDSDDE